MTVPARIPVDIASALNRDALAEAAVIAARAAATLSLCAGTASLPALEAGIHVLRNATIEACRLFRELENQSRKALK